MLDKSYPKKFNFVDGWLKKISATIRNWRRWSDIVAVMLHNILFEVITFA